MDDLRLEIDADVAAALRQRADLHGRSPEEEASLLLSQALGETVIWEPEVSVGELFRRLREEVGGGVDFALPDRSEWKDRPLDLLG